MTPFCVCWRMSHICDFVNKAMFAISIFLSLFSAWYWTGKLYKFSANCCIIATMTSHFKTPYNVLHISVTTFAIQIQLTQWLNERWIQIHTELTIVFDLYKWCKRTCFTNVTLKISDVIDVNYLITHTLAFTPTHIQTQKHWFWQNQLTVVYVPQKQILLQSVGSESSCCEVSFIFKKNT